ncbi:MAG: methionyl-tRNA formyltransferase [Actinobacteria bacterium]|nr:MAG: methionyl-tRNA formyltransferase [Actinomycetota bacterium]
MRVVFLGTPEFAVPSLRTVAEACDVALVITRPDAASKRGGALHPSAVRVAAEAMGLRTETPESLRGDAAAVLVAQAAPDLGVVAAYGSMLPAAVLAIPAYGFINVHASLLPRWRGAAPVQRAILAGDEVTGVSIMRVEEGLDTGPVCLERQVAVGDHTTESLTAEVARTGAAALADAITAIEAGTAVWSPQDDACATYAAKVTVADVAIGPDMTAAEARRRIRASSGSAPCRITVDGRRLTVTAVAPADAAVPPGRVVLQPTGVALGLADGAVVLTEVRPEGRCTMSAAAWVNGAHLPPEAVWGPA